MLTYKNNESGSLALFHRESVNHLWREVPPEQYQKYWEEREAELNQRCLDITNQYKAAVMELEAVTNDLKVSEYLLGVVVKDNVQKEAMIKFLEARINKGV